jgi:hypothetical protein
MADLRERYLERFTRALFRQPHSGFVLKGGTALRALYGPGRLTMDVDLDFTGARRSADSLHTHVENAIQAAARGLMLTDLAVHAPGRAEKSPRWKINFEGPDGLRRHVEIEVSRDPARVPPGTVVQRPFVPEAASGMARFWVDLYDEPTLAATKLAALLGREAARDVYDLDLLKDAAPSPAPALIRWAIDRAHLDGEDPVRVLWAHLDALAYARFEAELAPSLDPSTVSRIDETEWTAIKLRVGDYAGRLLGSAR